MDKFTITELEQAINRSRNAYSLVENKLAPYTKVLAELYGEKIYLGLSEPPRQPSQPVALSELSTLKPA